MYMKIGSNIKKIRELKNLTQYYIADCLNITQSTYSRYEKNELHFTEDMLQKLCALFGLSKEAVIQFDEQKLFIYIESMAKCEQYLTSKEQKLTEELLKAIQQENELLRNSVQDLRKMISILQKTN